jgi:hypothetical protein
MFVEVLKKATLSDAELAPHLKGAKPDEVQTSEDSSRCICYILSRISRTAIVLSEGELKDKIKVKQIALDYLFKYA